MKRSMATVFFAATILISGCAASPENNHVPYISPGQFQTYNCNELLAEIERIQTRVSQLTGNLEDKNPTKDKWVLGADLSLSWPALFALGGTKEQEAEYEQLKNEYDAIQQWAIIKQCPGVIPPAEKPPEFDPNLVETLKGDAVAGQR
ncbi:hypothetical protein [Nitrosomonas sp.]|uniref:hypothetical protein n=1 Tax=Nitrosomonas sp. TaxID=42353 RepID=UPI000AE38C77|nr:hypothetical protein [Nitrosomonas sp.]